MYARGQLLTIIYIIGIMMLKKYTIVIFQTAAILENSIDNLLEFWLLSNKYFPSTVQACFSHYKVPNINGGFLNIKDSIRQIGRKANHLNQEPHRTEGGGCHFKKLTDAVSITTNSSERQEGILTQPIFNDLSKQSYEMLNKIKD